MHDEASTLNISNEGGRFCVSESLILTQLEMVSGREKTEKKKKKALLLMYNSRLPLYTIIVLTIKGL